MKIKFGTEGWRGVISRDFTFDGVRRVAGALADFLHEENSAGKGVAIGYDRRFLSAEYAAECAGVLAARNIPVRLAEEYLPTPVLSFAVRDENLAAGLMITASHNPPEWNGIKIKGPQGGPASPELVSRVEKILGDSFGPEREVECLSLEEGRERGLVTALDPRKSYLEAVFRIIDFEAIKKARLRVAVDSMHGCGAGWTADILRDLGCEVTELNGSGDPLFGGIPPEPTEERVTALLTLMKSGVFHFGVANDGDADRLSAVDERGDYFSPQRIIAIFAKYLKTLRKMEGGAVKAVSATSMLDRLGERYGFTVLTTPVGFKHMSPYMSPGSGYFMAGEESGAIGVTSHLPERDGVFNSLLLAEIAAVTGLGPRGYLEEIFREIGPFDYGRLDLRFPREEMKGVHERVASIKAEGDLAGKRIASVDNLDGRKIFREDNSWLLIRVSGTEPLLRIYAEASDKGEVEKLIRAGKELAGIR
jgi:alpha-D-glucose phosphate-specific phosphoglucomutase